ncbi:MAG: hypothetical protein E6G89_05275 [Alphaproteobacteria bacterium]|nr:MAG: hypothetical protein E6G89_05275 [Alphaproteobacteria bacterium]
MFNKFALAAALALPLAVLGLSGSAMAGYSPTSHTPIARVPLQMHGAMSCAAARQMIRADGYRNVVTRECDARNYAFSAMRHGRAIVLRVNPRNGHIWRA